MDLWGTYAGIVEANNDPEKMGRVKARVPNIYGSTLVAGSIGTDDLPWAYPAGLPMGQSGASGGFSMLPEVGDHVWVRFLDGEPEKPVYEWGVQTQKGVKDMPVHSYNQEGEKVMGPKSTRWTRYGHVVEINSDSLALTTQSGYFLQVLHSTDLQGYLFMGTPLGNYFYVDDESDGLLGFANEDVSFNCGSSFTVLARIFDITALSGNISFVGGRKFTVETEQSIDLTTQTDFTMESNLNMSITSGINLDISVDAIATMSFATLRLGGETAIQPFVLGLPLVEFCTTLLTWLASHTHGNGNEGAPTTPPIVPPTGSVAPTPAELISQTIFGQ